MGAETALIMPLSPRPGDGRSPPGGEVPAAGGMLADGCVIPGVGLPSENVALFGTDVLPVLPALRELLPGGLPRGSVVTAEDSRLLGLALAAGASVAGAWCAIAGLPDLGVAAAADAGLDPGRLLLVADPGRGWPQVVASLLDGCELVLLRPPARPSAQVRRRLEAVMRRHGGVLVVAGDWDGAQGRLTVTHQEWAGIGAGHGRLRSRLVRVVATGRARPGGRGPAGCGCRVRMAPWPWPQGSAARSPAGPVLAGTVLAGTVLAGTVLARTVLAGTVLAGTVWAETVLAGTALAGTALAGTGKRARPSRPGPG